MPRRLYELLTVAELEAQSARTRVRKLDGERANDERVLLEIVHPKPEKRLGAVGFATARRTGAAATCRNAVARRIRLAGSAGSGASERSAFKMNPPMSEGSNPPPVVTTTMFFSTVTEHQEAKFWPYRAAEAAL
jgi:hypothetical protein